MYCTAETGFWMRLTCPNCSARYEVDDTLVPPEGRDVQCSNCATTWFQPGNRSQMEDMAVEETSVADVEEPGSVGAPAETPVRRELDPAIRDLLREEREREEDLRRSDMGEALESQEEMPLERPAREIAEPDVPDEDDDDAETLAALRAATALTENDAAQHAPSGRDLLPDIEEINSTLRATTDRNVQDVDTTDIETMEAIPRRRRGFRFGLMLVLLVTAALVGAYTYAPELSEAIPQADAYLAQYTDQVDMLRLRLDDMAQTLIERLNTSTGGDGYN